ncbi:hypothetical protein MMC15_003706 [Xylographa vitiligo]|nr:hypothetical protein [Xylographa vitiligo]
MDKLGCNKVEAIFLYNDKTKVYPATTFAKLLERVLMVLIAIISTRLRMNKSTTEAEKATAKKERRVANRLPSKQSQISILIQFHYYWTDNDTDNKTLIEIFPAAVISLICVDIDLLVDQLVRAAMEQAKLPGVPRPQAIHHELRTAENSAVHVLAKLQSFKKSNPHLTLLDIGADSGTISVTFTKAIPDGHVTAVDLNPDILPRARAITEMAGVTNIQFQQGDAYRLPFPRRGV